MGLSTNKPKLDLSGFDEAVSKKSKLDLSGFDKEVSKKKEPTQEVAKTPPTGGVSASGSVQTQPTSGLKPTPKYNWTRYNKKTEPEGGFIEGARKGLGELLAWYGASDLVEQDAILSDKDVDGLVDEAINRAQTLKSFEKSFYGPDGKTVNKDFSKSYLRGTVLPNIGYADNGYSLNPADQKRVQQRFEQALYNRKAMTPAQTEKIMNNININVYNANLTNQMETEVREKEMNNASKQEIEATKKFYDNSKIEGPGKLTLEQERKRQDLRNQGVPEQDIKKQMEEEKQKVDFKYENWFDEDVFKLLTEQDKKDIQDFINNNPGIKTKYSYYATRSPESQAELITQAIKPRVDEALNGLQIYSDNKMLEMLGQLNDLNKQLGVYNLELNLLKKQIENFTPKELTPEQKRQLEIDKNQFQTRENEYVQATASFNELKAQLDPVFQELARLKPAAEAGNQNAINAYNGIYNSKKEEIDKYNAMIPQLEELLKSRNQASQILNRYATSQSDIASYNQYLQSVEKYNKIFDEVMPLYRQQQEIVQQLPREDVDKMFQLYQGMNSAIELAKQLEKTKTPTIGDMITTSMANNPLWSFHSATTFPLIKSTGEFVLKGVGGVMRTTSDVLETLSMKPEDYYSGADFAADMIVKGFDLSGESWIRDVMPGYEMKDFYDMNGNFVYSPLSVTVGAFEQIGVIAGAAIGTAAMGGAGSNAAIIAPMFFATYDDNKELAKQLGYDSKFESMSAGVLFSLIEGVSELILPDVKFFEGDAKKQLFKMFLDNYQQGGKTVAMKSITEAIAKEYGEELAVEFGKVITTAMTGAFGGNNQQYTVTGAELFQTFVFTALASGSLKTVNVIGTSSNSFNNAMKFEMAKDLKSSIEMIESYRRVGKMNDVKADQLKKELTVISSVQGQLPDDLSQSKRVVVSGLYAERAALEQKMNDPNVTNEVKEGYKSAINKINTKISQVIIADDTEFNDAYNKALEEQTNKVASEIKEKYPELSATPKEEAPKMELSEQDKLRTEILTDIFGDTKVQRDADSLEQRMNNAEEISVDEINTVLDGLYAQVESIMDNYFDNEAGKQYAQALLDKIDKIKNYEFATGTKTDVITERKAVQTARASLQETASVINLARAPKRTATITSEDGTTGTYSIEVGPDGAVTFEQKGAEPIRVGNVNDVNKSASIVETVLNENGLPQSVTFSVVGEDGRKHTITVEAKANLKPQQLLDLAINIRANELGTVDPTDFDTAFEEVSREVETKTYPAQPQAEKEGVTPTQQQDAIQKPSTEEGVLRAEQPQVGLQEVGQGDKGQEATQAPLQDQEVRSSDIERRRQEELKTIGSGTEGKFHSNDGKKVITGNSKEDVINQINAKYDAELAALNQAEPQAPAQEGQEVETAANNNIRESIKQKLKMFGVNDAVKNLVNLFRKSGLRVVVIDDPNEFERVTGAENAQGIFRSDEGVIYLNPAKFEEGLGRLVVYHEGIHPIINIIRNTDPKLYNAIRDGLKKLSESNNDVAQSFRWVEANSINRDPLSIEDEQIVETLARIADGRISIDSIPQTLMDRIVEFFNTIALSMGLGRPFRQGDLKSAASIARQITKALQTGEGLEGIVGKGNVGKYQYVDNNGDAITENDLQYRIVGDFTSITTGITFEYLQNSDEFNKLVEQGFITNDMNLEDFQDAFVVLHSPDAAFSGNIKKNGKVLVDGSGGVYYPIKFHKDGFFWASTKSGAAVLANVLNESARLNNGRVLMALTAAPKDKLLSSTTMANGVIDIFTSKIMDNKVNLRELDVVNALKNAAKAVEYDKNGKKIGLKLNLTGEKNIDVIVSKIKEKLSPDVTTFKDRKLFSLTFLDQIATKIKGKEAEQILGRFLREEMGFEGYKQQGKIENRYNISKTNLTEAISNMLQEPLLRSVNENAIYAVVEIDAREGYKKGQDVVKPIEPPDSKKHDSYPRTIVPINDKIKVKLHILQDRKSWKENVIDPKTNDVVNKERQLKLYPTSGVSTQPLKVKTQFSPAAARGEVSYYYDRNREQFFFTDIEIPNGFTINLDPNPSKYEQDNYGPFVNLYDQYGYLITNGKIDEIKNTIRDNYPVGTPDLINPTWLDLYNNVDRFTLKQLGFILKKLNPNSEWNTMASDVESQKTPFEANKMEKDLLKLSRNTLRDTINEYFSDGNTSDNELNFDIKKDGLGVKPNPRSLQYSPANTRNIMADVVNGFYSPIENRLMETKVDRQSANKWIGFMGKKDEAIYTGVLGWLESKNPQEQVSKKDIMDFMKNNRIEVREVDTAGYKPESLQRFDDILDTLRGRGYDIEVDYYGGPDMSIRGYPKEKMYIDRGITEEDLINEGYEIPSTFDEDVRLFNEAEKIAKEVRNAQERYDELGVGGVRYPDKQLPGESTDYKEVLVVFTPKGEERLDQLVIKEGEEGLTSEEQKEFDAIQKRLNAGEFKSPHWSQPNILVHLRMNTRTDANGNKVLFLEEIQSDWGQKGKKEGFEGNKEKELFNQFKYEIIEVNGKKLHTYFYPDGETVISSSENKERAKVIAENEARMTAQSIYTREVPSAPFVTDTNAWTKLGLKIALKEAVRQKADALAWTTGEQQNERYDLSKQVDEIGWQKNENGTYNITPKKDGSVVGTRNIMSNLTLKQVEDYVGKDVAQKIENEEGKEWDGGKVKQGNLKGQQLKVGGKGMKAFYGDTKNPGIVGNVAVSLVNELTGTKPSPSMVEINSVEQPAIEVTPEVKDAVKQGMAQFSPAVSRMTVEKPGMDTIKAANLTPAEVANWRKENKVSQREGRVSEVQQSAQDLADGKKTIYEHIETVRAIQPTRKTDRLKPMPSVKEVVSALADNQVKTGVLGLNVGIPEGTKVGSRLDIPSFNNYGINVVSVHDGTASGTSIGYGRAVSLSDVTFKTSPSQALNVATGASKGTFSRMMGTWNNESEESVFNRAKEAMNDPDWIQIGTNPFRHSWFYDKETGMPVMSASEILQVGNVVLAKDARVLDLTNAKDKAEFEDKFKVKLKSGKTSQFSPAVSRGDVSKAMNKAFPKGQMSIFAPRGMMNTAEVARNQYPLHMVLVQVGVDAYNNQGIRNYSSFITYAKNYDDRIEKNPYMERVWEDVTRIVNGKKPLIQSERDYRDFLVKENNVAVANAERLKKRNRKDMVTNAKTALFDSRAELFKALSQSSNKLWSIAANYVNVIGGMGAKSIYTANFLSDSVFKGLSTKNEYLIGDQMQSESTIFNNVLVRIRVLEIQRKMEDKFNEFKALDNSYKNETDPAKKQAFKDARDNVRRYLDRNNMLQKNAAGEFVLGTYQYANNLNERTAYNELLQLKQQYPDLYDKLMERAETYHNAFTTLLKMQKDAGMLSQESYDEMVKYKYVPMRYIGYMIEDIVVGDEVKTNKKQSDLIKRLKGGSEDNVDMAFDEALKFQAYMVIRAIAKNNAMQKIYEAAKSENFQGPFYEPDVTGVDADGNFEYGNIPAEDAIIYFFIDGKRMALATNKEIAMSFNGSNIKFNDLADEKLGYLLMTIPFRAVTTNLNPGFGLAQLILDIPQALLTNEAYSNITTGLPRILFRDLKLLAGKGFGSLFKSLGLDIGLDKEWNELANEAREYGGLITFTGMDNETMGVVQASEKAKDKKTNILTNLLVGYRDKVELFGTTMETVTRLAVYRKMRNNLESEYRKNNNGQDPKGEDLDNIRTQAAATSLNVLNYNRGGVVVKGLNRALAYLNVAFQVPYSVIKYAKRKPFEASLKAMEVAMWPTLVQLLCYLSIDDDDDKEKYLEIYNNYNEYEKFNYWHMYNLLWDGKDPETMIVRIKKPTILLPLINSTEVAVMYVATGGKTMSPKDYSKNQLLSDIVDMQPLGLDLISSVPSFNAFSKYVFNKDFYRNIDVVKNEKELFNWEEGQNDPNVGKFYKYVAERTKYLGDNDRETLESISPARMDAAVKSAVGNYETNITTALPLLGAEGLLSWLSSDYSEFKVPAQTDEETKSIMEKVWDGVGLKKRFFAKVPEVNPQIYKSMEFEKKMKNYLREEIRSMVDVIISEKKSIDETKQMIREYYKMVSQDNQYYDIENLDSDLKNAFKYVNNQKWLKDKPKWYRTLIFAPDTESKILIFDISTENMDMQEKRKAFIELYEKEFITDNPDWLKYVQKEFPKVGK